MKKLLALTLTALMCASLSACGGGSNATTSGSDSAVKAGDTASYAKALKGKKVAVVRNLAAGDHTQQFLDGCVSEGKALGFTVDTFVTDGDDARTQEVTAQCIQKGYDGLIISHAQLSYAYNMLKPDIDKGIKVVTFDSMPLKDGDAKGQLLQDITSTAQDDNALASLSLGFMMEEFDMKVLKTFMGPGIPPLDRRNVVYTKLEQEGKIKTVEVIAPSDTANVRGDMTNKTAAILPKYSKGSVDAIWGCYDELAKGVLQSLNDAKRTDIPMYTIDISNDDIQLMLKNKDVWKSTAAVDPKLIGIVDTRLLAKKFLNLETPEYFNLKANLVKTSQLSSDISMTNLITVINGWGDATSKEDSLNEPWMDEVKKINGK
ncbi:sugar ABC transporter substrate-binding protein [Clostridium magnum]|uniref:Periplasmic binding protein domain-containing protein n=1 Tax=Clostridium magnum DSM 2767 TaxID=1121326 RepID=A0A161YFZ2_9CLOT|nr:sugar ABC transporter substrate-binding protein [Clostridium magnum]KZL89032.1 hypothetical protein CLMAG_57300 [Clostridium magnum DSM 2767]SHI23155.1 simple sugar transport system substrate-binding protein [Clostridium magnum DSM 2767]